MPHSLDILKNLTVLYVEDDAQTAIQTTDLLENLCDEVIHVSSAEAALEAFGEHPVHIVISDIELPGKDGLELCRTIRAMDPKVPIFIMTVHDNKAFLQRAVKLNLVDYLIKPVGASSIRQTLVEVIERLEREGAISISLDATVTYFPLSAIVKTAQQTYKLPQKENALLGLLIKNRSRIVTRETIEHVVNGSEPFSESAYKNLLYRLRKKVGKERIVSVSGMGVKVVLES